MSINFTTTFADLGKVFAALANLDGFGSTVAPVTVSNWGASGYPVIKCQDTMVSDILTRLEGSGLTSLISYNSWQTAVSGVDNSLQNVKSTLSQLAQQILIKRVNNDVSQPNSSLNTALVEFVRQMKSQSVTVKQCTVSDTVTAGTNNTGDGNVVVGLNDPNGASTELAYDESLILKCTIDQFTGGTAGQEQVSVAAPASATALSHLWPAGSGASGTLTVVDPTLGNSGGNLLTGGSSTAGAWKAFTGSVPTNWLVDVGASQISDGTSSKFAGAAHCLEFAGDGSTLTSLYQNFANGSITGGSSYTLLPATVYLFSMRFKLSAGSPAAGVLTVSLTDGSGTVLNNNANVAQTLTQDLTTISDTSWHTLTGSFQTPTVMPTNARIRVKLTTALSNTANLFMDFAALTAPTRLYSGGPYLALFRGSVDLAKWISEAIGDTWTVAITNDFGSSTHNPNQNFQTCFNRYFGMASAGLILPSASSPTIGDGLIA